MLLSQRPSGLLVPAQDERAIERELARIDPRLYLTYEIERGQRLYRVMCEYAGDKYLPVCDWRDEQGEPLPLSTGLLELVRSLAPRGGVTAQETFEANERLRQQAEREFHDDLEEIVADMGPRLRETRSAVLPRGTHLRRSREKRRARGGSG
jgi:hypothetical protein